MGFNIESIKRKMRVKYPFFGSIVANVDYRANINISTAGTDGKVVYYNPEFLESLSVEEQTFIFAHEICHIAFNHILRSEGKEHSIWNKATDAVINAFLRRDGLKMVKGGVDIEGAINYNAEQLYEKLLQEKQQQQQNGQQGQSQQNKSEQSCSGGQNQQEQSQSSKSKNCQDNTSEDGSSSFSNINEQEKQDVGHDTHSMWEDAIKKHKEKQVEKDKVSERSELEKKQEEIEQLGEKRTFKKNLEEKKKELEELKKTLSEQAMGPGLSTNRDIRNITDIGESKPLIDWRYLLKEAIKYDVDWSYRNATIENGVISANLEEQPMPETEIVLDTSGSINETLLKNFLRECKNILQHSRLKVGCFDTEFYGFHEIRTEEDIENMEFVGGGGGTDFDVAVGAFSRRVENKIIFTDGDAYMPDMPLDAIWIVFGGIKINPKGGKVIQIDGEQLNKLYYDNNFHSRKR